MRYVYFAIVLAGLAATACGSGKGGSSAFTSEDPTTAAPAAPPAAGDDPGGGFAQDVKDAGVGDGGAPKIVFYANTDTTLYQLDPDDLTKPMTKVGDFDCVGSGAATSVMTDVAVDKHGKVYGVSPAAAWPLTIEPGGVVHCDAKWPLEYGTHFNGLTFAPENTVDVDEVLIGGNAEGAIYRIDANTGATTQIGTLGTDPASGKPWTISGDMVFLANGGDPIGYATVRTCSDATTCDRNDTLLEIDVKALKPGTQSVAKAVRGPVNGFGSIYGITALHDKAYGFSRRGDFIQIDSNSGAGTLMWADTTLKFAGAGVTTIAPVTAPPPR